MSADVPPGSAEQLQAEIRGLQEELIACQRLAVLGSLAAMVAHEFNNLLTPVVARTEAALTGDDDVPFMRQALDRTLVQTQRAISVSRHLLDLAHAGACPSQTCLVAVAVREAIDTMTRPFEKDAIQLRVAVPEDLKVQAREELLCQVLLNLLLNARQAMQGASGALAVTATAEDGCAHIEVKDTGKGIAPELLEKVFSPFLAADPRARPNDWKDVGIGLSVCRMIAHHHGARIEARANSGPGCTFSLCWPLA